MSRLLERQIDQIKRNDPNEPLLYLHNQGLDDEDVEELVELLLQHNTHIRELGMSFNDIRSRGAIALARLTHVEKIDLDNNNIYDEGAIALAENPYIKKVDLSRNCVTDVGAKRIAEISHQVEFKLERMIKIQPETLTAVEQRLETNRQQELRKALRM